MCPPQRCVRGADCTRGDRQACRGNRPIGELFIQIGFLHNQLLTERYRFGLHGGDELLHFRPLLVRQIKRVGKLQHMHRAGISVDLGRERQAHAAARPQVGDLLLRQRLDRSRFKTGIWLL